MLPVDYMKLDFGKVPYVNGETFSKDDGWFDYELCDDEFELMQSTGLKDKRGTEIYEKDIVKFSNRDSRYKSKGEVVWWQGEAAFLIKCDNEIYKHFDEVSELEVIDNIYENPELLGENNEL
ncbi:YopX family protein [Campylobacter mucosalis]|nr:YopX family protein [Campylobacter mucosalis]